ncbi:restriction endonuclease subunit S [Vibrio diabolicus]|uniref:restriction endonuclease subunit S n=1 Tax=Vibrio diabolicus TaxID=50719 RepID=UPI002941ACA9|nr:restriction endonuclease subunit S [Vibrio diabolicus]MDV5036594.1 restriction endonuclease subunit S [Vibrio diabolicus]
MTGRYKAYPEYKNSGAEWLDCLPSHWETVALKMLIDVRDGTHDTPTYVEPSESSYPLVTSKDVTGGKINLTSCKQISEEDYNSIIKRSAVSIGDILMPMIGTVGSPILIESNSNIAIKNLSLFKTSSENNQLDTKYLLYFLNSNECTLQFSLESRGGVQNFVSLGTLRNLGLPFVPRSEQQKIANFLDHETAKIDTLITKQEKLIELLKEKRQAVISHAVTKGLNPDAPMKDSGVEWLGEVPEHWAVLPTKRFFRLVAEPSPKNHDKELLSVYAAIGVAPRKELEQKGNKASNTDGYWLVKKGDIIVNKLLAWMGAVGYSEYNGVTSPAYDILRKTKDINPKFYHYLFRQEFTQKEFKRWSRGIMEMRLRLYFEELGRIMMPMPPKNEQDAIVDEIESMDSKFSQVEEKSKLQIELLKERKTALISAAITGKIDVRDRG